MNIRVIQFLIFFIIFISVYLGIHYYIYSQVSYGLMLTHRPREVLRILFIVFAFTFVLGHILAGRYGAHWVKPIEYFGSFWMGLVSIGFSVFVLLHIMRVFSPSAQLRYGLTLAGIAVVFLLSIYSVYNGHRPPVVRDIKIPLKDGKGGPGSITIVQLSDLHLNMLVPDGWLEDVVERTNALDPDVTVITGDLVDGNLCKRGNICSILGRLRSRFGVYAVTGNHEYYEGIDDFLEIARESGIRVLRNECVSLGGVLELAGVDDDTNRSRIEVEEGIDRALSSCIREKPAVLLSHKPIYVKRAVERGTDLMLCGHTHAGQIPPLDLLAFLIFRYSYGLYRVGGSYVYTTSGTGTWGPPMRLFSRSEIVRFTLFREK